MKVKPRGIMAKFNIIDRRSFHSFDAEMSSDALRSAIKHIMLIILISDIPSVANILTTEVVLRTLVVLMVDNADVSNLVLLPFSV
jgi:hypothetical protein